MLILKRIPNSLIEAISNFFTEHVNVNFVYFFAFFYQLYGIVNPNVLQLFDILIPKLI